MTCRELIEFLDDYFEGQLAEARRKQFERHLAVCPDCRNYLQSYKMTVEAGQAAFAGADAQVPSEVPEGLLRAVVAAAG